MSDEYVILGFLSYRPRTGYDLNKTFAEVMHHIWHIDQARIYYVLKKLEEKAWVHSEIEVQDGSPNKKIYHITESGTEALQTWLAVPQEEATRKLTWLAQVFFGVDGNPEEMQGILSTHQERIQSRLDGLLTNHLPNFDDVIAQSDSDDEFTYVFYRLLTLYYGVVVHQAALHWHQTAQALLGRLEEKESPETLVQDLMSQLKSDLSSS